MVDADEQLVRAGNAIVFGYLAVAGKAVIVFDDFVFHAIFEYKILAVVVGIDCFGAFDAQTFH
jgi:hypothetical protein